MNGSGDTWFVALPDREGTADAAAALRSRASQEVPHPSGRPWLIGCWSPDELWLARAGDVSVAVLGQCPGTAGFTEQVAGVRSAADGRPVDEPDPPGYYHSILSVPPRSSQA
ncbi:hypothetical protein GCM10029978_086810 [Actinoallomurus acanthiterrae]